MISILCYRPPSFDSGFITSLAFTLELFKTSQFNPHKPHPVRLFTLVPGLNKANDRHFWTTVGFENIHYRNEEQVQE